MVGGLYLLVLSSSECPLIGLLIVGQVVVYCDKCGIVRGSYH